MNPVKIVAMDHIVLNVANIERSLEFYTGVLGLAGERIREYRDRKVGFPSVRINDRTIIDLNPLKDAPAEGAAREKRRGNLDHFCVVVEKTDLSAIVNYLKARDVTILQEPVSRWGARGRATSIYLLDPDGNEIEIRCY